MYLESDLVRIGKRENNKKRNYLVVNRLQGKHIPVLPSEALSMFDALAEIIEKAYSGEKLLLIGFAETATAIGAEAAIKLGAQYIQTTREIVHGVSYLFFSESHSHATEQKLVREDIDKLVGGVDRIIFIEDEVTTGNTILNIVNIMEDRYNEGKNDLSCNLKFSVASILNGMSVDNLSLYEERGIKVHYLVKIDNSKFSEIADSYTADGKYIVCDTTIMFEVKKYEFTGWINS